jgi:hypothetical protein
MNRSDQASLTAVITTIQDCTSAVKALSGKLRAVGGELLVIGDEKGPVCFSQEGAIFYSLQAQRELNFKLAMILPTGHYCRKNLGYLLAIKNGAIQIYETDDDNAPNANWRLRKKAVEAVMGKSTEWLNAYHFFSEQLIWPRGFPLDEIHGAEIVGTETGQQQFVSSIQQGLANGSPDVDAVWRLVLDQPIEFDSNASLYVPPGSWCPFNSQSTWWWPEAYPLMYLPSHCSFRMTDIWRSFVAQRCLWELGHGVVFHAPEVFQERNPHNLMRDFSDEISGYLRNKELVRILQALNLDSGEGAQGRNLLACYQALIAAGFFPEKELQLVTAWLDDLVALGVDCAARR